MSKITKFNQSKSGNASTPILTGDDEVCAWDMYKIIRQVTEELKPLKLDNVVEDLKKAQWNLKEALLKSHLENRPPQ